MVQFIIPVPPPPGGTPDHLRQRKSQEALKRKSGRRLSVNLPADAALALRQVRAKHGLSTDKDAVIAALKHYARQPA